VMDIPDVARRTNLLAWSLAFQFDYPFRG
jgi:hypothetical protein